MAILLSYATARVLLAGDAEAREEEYMASSLHEPLNGRQSLEVQKILSCRTLLNKDGSRQVELAGA